MWREVERSASAGGQRVFQNALVVGWVTAKWIVQARVLSQQEDQCTQSRLVNSRWQNWIRARDSGESATSHSAARTVGCTAFSCSRVSWTSYVGRPLHPGLSLAGGACMAAASTRLHALGRMAVSTLRIMYFSLCKIAQSEPSRAGAGTWRWHALSEAALRCRRIRVQHESTWIPEG